MSGQGLHPASCTQLQEAAQCSEISRETHFGTQVPAVQTLPSTGPFSPDDLLSLPGTFFFFTSSIERGSCLSHLKMDHPGFHLLNGRPQGGLESGTCRTSGHGDCSLTTPHPPALPRPTRALCSPFPCTWFWPIAATMGPVTPREAANVKNPVRAPPREEGRP